MFTSDNLTPNGNNSVFTLSEPPADANTVFVTVDGVVQRAPVHYTTSGTTITFTSAPPASSNVHVRHLGFRTSTTVTGIPVATYMPQPNIASPTITGTISGGPITVDASGNMGLGVSPNSGWTTSNGRVLELTGNGSLYGYNSGGTYSTMIGSNIYWDGTNWKAKTTGTTGIYQFTGSSFAFFNSPSTSAGANASLISVLSNAGANNTIVLQGASSSAGIGIAFPATQSASADANTLDDYEEGTFTPSMSPSSGSWTTATTTGKYVKIGQVVTLFMSLTITTVGTGSGFVAIGNMPFTAFNPVIGAGNRAGVGIAREDATSGVAYQVFINGNSVTGNLQGLVNATTVTMGSGYVFEMSLQYITAT